MKIAIIGSGYVGLVTGSCLADTGNTVYCIDKDLTKIKSLKAKKLPIYEPGLEKIFLRNIKEKRLFFTSKLYEIINEVTLVFLALPTPAQEDGSADLSYVLTVAFELGKLINSYKIIITKSTVPVGTAHLVKNEIGKNYKGDFDVVSNPEFLKEGVAVDDFMKPDRIVIGMDSDRPKQILTQLYEPYIKQGNPLIFMDTISAELTKYAANAFLATKISFMNEIANICEKVGANVDLIRKGISNDERIGKRFLFAGIGYGGSCFPKDIRAIDNIASKVGYDFSIIKAVNQVNEKQKLALISKIKAHFKNKLKGLTIALWGLTFKPNTDDLREAPAIVIIKELLKLGVKINAFDPEGMSNFKKIHSNLKINLANNQYDCLTKADALVICTEWNEFRTPDFNIIKSKLAKPIIFDGRNIYSTEMMKKAGFIYFSIGRK